MNVPELAEPPAAAPAGASRPARRAAGVPRWLPVVALAAFLAGGLALRLILAGQALFADELSTYWISATHGLRGVLSLMYGTGRIHHAEITPPLSFLASWLTSRFGSSPELVRVPSLIAGTASIWLVYAVGLRSVGRRAALAAAALTALAPFMVYYSSEARAYALMMAFILGATLSLLLALDTGRRRWWVLYALCSCAAFYSHYTCVFVLAVQAGWVLWRVPTARRATVLANVGAAALVLPWLPGLINDLRSPTLKILSALSPFTLHDVRFDLTHWSIGYPIASPIGLATLPGVAALILLGGSVAIAIAGSLPALGRRARQISDRTWLIVALALAAPVGEVLYSALHQPVIDVRNLASSWPYLALAFSALLTAARRPLGALAALAAVVAFGIGGVRLLETRFQRPDYQSPANFIAHQARPGDVVIDETGALSPGPLTGLDVYLHTRAQVVRAEAPAERVHPYGFSDPIVPLQSAVRLAVAAAHGNRVFLVRNIFQTNIAGLKARLNPLPTRFPAGYRLVETRNYAGIGGTLVGIYAGPGPRQQ